jgi:hypothetical protein
MGACLWGLVLAACATPPPPASSESFCRVGSLAFHTDFEAAALHGCAPGENGPELTIAPEYAPVNPSPWYAWRMTGGPGAPGGSTAVTVTQRYRHGWHRYAPWVSTDGERWERLPDARVLVMDDGSAEFRLDVPPNGLFVAAQPPLTSSSTKQWASELARICGLQRSEVGRSVQGRALSAYLHEQPGQTASVVLIGRQHPPEVTGGLAYRDFVERLCSDDELARRFRDRFTLALLPEINPDGVVRGHWRTNALGVDLNRDWGPFTQPETRGVAEWLAGLDERSPLLLFMDFHSTHHDVFYVPHDDEDPAPRGYAAAWRAALQERLGDEMPAWSGGHNPGLPTAKSWVQSHYGIFAMTFEVGDNTRSEQGRRVARTAAEEAMRVLLEIGDETQ